MPLQNNNKNRINFYKLEKFVVDVLTKAGLDEYSVMAVSTGLLETSLRGVDSHGVRLLPHYVRSAATGRKNPKPNFKFTSKFPAMQNMDADNAYGHAAGFKAIDLAMSIAENVGVCVIGVHNSSHPGAMASFALRAARKGYMAFAFTHADSLMLSHNGTKPFFGTNPVCFAAPRKDMEPFCMDMATTKIPWNRVVLSRTEGIPLEENLVADEFGNPTVDSNQARCILPIGEHKGYALSSMVEVLCSIFTGAPYGTNILSMFKAPMEQGRNLGQFYIVMRVDGCVSHDEFTSRLSAMTNDVHASPARGVEKVILPGDKEILVAKERMENGVPLDQATYEGFLELSKQFNVSFE